MNADQQPSRGLRILVAEDSPTQAQHLRHILEGEGYDVTLARNGHEALIAARESRPAILISDVIMPGMDGYELCRQVKRDPALSGIPVILVTTMSEPQDVIRGLECGADNFILKPFDQEYLLNRLRFVILHREMRQTDRSDTGVQIVFNGEQHFITADRLQILNLLLSTYEAAVQRNKELSRAEDRIREMNRRLESLVAQRTRELYETEQRFRLMVEAVKEYAIIVGDPQGNVVSWNLGAERLIGFRAGEIVGRPIANLYPPDRVDAGQPDLEMRMATERGQFSDQGWRLRRDGTRFWASVNVTAVRNEAGALRGFVWVTRDLTEEKRAEEAIRSLNANLEARVAERTAALQRANEEIARASRHKDEFLANMSHELRTPLNAILGLSESLLEQIGGPLTERQVRSVSTILSSGQHLLALINDILDLSKIEAGKVELQPETLDIEEFCESCLAFVHTQAMRKSLDVSFENPDGLTTFVADPRRFKQVLVNLLSNAVKFTPDGGKIGLIVSDMSDEDCLQFTVWDTGIGIAAADTRRLFRSFTQIDSGLSRSQEGTGLGLALVSRLVELHAGGVALESEPGRGSRFMVRIPKHRDATPAVSTQARAAAAGDAATPHQPFAVGSVRVLIAEDNEANITTLGDYLMDLGYEVHCARNGRLAVDLARSLIPGIILMDIQMPVMDGFAVMQELQSDPALRRIPVVALTALTLVGDRERCLAAGAVAYLSKPVKLKSLAGLLSQILLAHPPPP